MTVLHTE